MANGDPNLDFDDLIINTNAMSVEFDIDYGLGFETKLIGSEKRKGIGLSGEERKALGQLTRRRIVLAFCKMNLGFECGVFFITTF